MASPARHREDVPLSRGPIRSLFHQSPARLGPEDIRAYLLHLINEKVCSWSWWKQAVATLRFLARGNEIGASHCPRSSCTLAANTGAAATLALGSSQAGMKISPLP